MSKLSTSMAKGSETSKAGEIATYRDTIESIWVAIILAFVLRAFVIEAFVIPTGSMAPRLLGEHWDLRCPSCGYEFVYGSAADSTSHKVPQTVASARCPNCRFNYPSNNAQMVNSGDRVLVLKYLYQFSEPQPWDVVVFKNPQDNRQNYIKRLIGLPGECIQIVHGDIFVAPDPNGPWTIRRKGRAQDALWQVIYDNDYRPRADWLIDSNCPRWSHVAGNDSWDIGQEDGRVFAWRGGPEARQLRFGLGEDSEREAVLFLPNYGYNPPASLERERSSNNHFINADICTDLRLSCVMRPQAPAATAVLKLSSFEFEFEGTVCSDGNVSISGRNLPGRPARQFIRNAQVSPLRQGQGYKIALTNVDFQLTLWVDDVPVLQSTDSEYGVDFNWIANRIAGEFGREPIPAPRVAIEGHGGAFELWHVKLDRDEFYTQTQQSTPTADAFRSTLGDYARAIDDANAPQSDIRHRKAEPGRPGWGTFGYPIQLAKNPADPDLDEFFVLGDNSPSSLDGRCWILAAPSLRLYDDGKFQYQLGTVPRYNLIGRALFVYWPSGFRVPGLNELPIIPNVGKMRLIR